MVAEVIAGLGAFKTMIDLAKGLKDINDATVRNGAVIELQEHILTAQMAQAALIERVRDLEEKVASFETWNTEKERYELKGVGYGTFIRMLKANARGAEPPHWVCDNCYQKRMIAIIQRGSIVGPRAWFCPSCKTTYDVREQPKWLD